MKREREVYISEEKSNLYRMIGCEENEVNVSPLIEVSRHESYLRFEPHKRVWFLSWKVG